MTPELAMRRGIVLSLLGALFPLLPLPSPAAPLCSDPLSTADQTRCLIKALEASDRQLQQTLMGVAKEAQQIPGPIVLPLWRENLKGFPCQSQGGLCLCQIGGLPRHRLWHHHDPM